MSEAAASNQRTRLTLPMPLAISLQQALNALIARDPDAQRRLAAMADKLIELRFDGLDMAAYFFCHADGIEVAGRHDGEVDAGICGAPFSLASMAFSRRALFNGEVRLEGDVELAKRFHRLLDQIDVDWEEELSHLVGDLAAHQLGSVARGAKSWLQRAAGSLRQDSSEYLQEELCALPARVEISPWLDGIDQLREASERLEARIDLLEQAAQERNR